MIASLLQYATVLAFSTFVCIAVWAYQSKRAKDFTEAANLPFAIEDDLPGEVR